MCSSHGFPLVFLIIAMALASAAAVAHNSRRGGSDAIMVSISGRIVCESNSSEAANLTIEFKDSGAFSFLDHLIDSQKTDSRGRFKLSGAAEEHWFMGGKIEPYLEIPSHHCGGKGNNPEGKFTWKKMLTPIALDEFKNGFDYGMDHTFVIDATDPTNKEEKVSKDIGTH